MKKTFSNILLKLILGLVVVLTTAPSVLAVGETYHWKDSGKTVLVGEGGAYQSPVELQHGTDTTTAAVFDAAYSNGCPNHAELKLHAEIPLDQYKQTAAATGNISASGCPVALDSTISIAAASATPAAASTQNTASSQSLHTDNSCKAKSFGWLLCPAYEWLLNTIEDIETGIILPFLKVDPLPMGQNRGAGYQVWSAVKTLADGFLVIAFLVLIFAHTMSVGIDSYSIKKLLPRVIAAAALIQFSYVLVAFGVDAANVLGAGIGQIVLKPIQGFDTASINGVTGGLGLAGLIAGAFALAGGVLSGSFLIVLVGAFFTVILVFFTLVARQILITFLLIMAPLAFVAWILPNTEHLFGLWYKSLIRLLLMYPLIVLLFASGKIFGALTVSSTVTGHGSQNESIRSLISIVANIIPLFMIPVTFRLAGAALGSAHNLIRVLHGGTQVVAKRSSAYERLKTRTDQRRTELAAGQKVNFLGANVGGAGFVTLGRGPSSIPGRLVSKRSRSSNNARSMANFARERAVWDKRLEEEGFTFEGYEILALGKKHGQNKIRQAMAAGDMAGVAKYNAGMIEAERYINVAAARTAALKWRGKIGIIGDADRHELIRYTGDTAAGKLIRRQEWNSAREGARKGSVHLAFTDVDTGKIDRKGLSDFVIKQNLGTWANYSKDAYKVMRDENILQTMATSTPQQRQLLVNLLGPRGAAPEQQAIIRQVLDDTRHLAPPTPPPAT